MESLWYEVSPYLYFAGGAMSLAESGSTLGALSGALLLLTACVVLRMRWSHRAQRGARRGIRSRSRR